MRPAPLLLLLSYAGGALPVWVLPRTVPWFLVPDVPFLCLVFAGLFLPGPSGVLVALGSALFREVLQPAPPWSFFLSSLSLFVLVREIRIRLFIRAEPFILILVSVLLAAESASVSALLAFRGASPVSGIWLAKETVRIAWTSLLAVPFFMTLPDRWQKVRE